MIADGVALVGCGTMGGAMLRRWLSRGVVAADHVAVIDPSFASRVDEQTCGVRIIADRPPRPLSARVVVIAVKPQNMETACAPIAAALTAGAVVLSIVAGKTLSSLEMLFGKRAAIVRAMPNTPAAIGRGVTVLSANAAVTKAQRSLCQKLVEALGTAVWLGDEALLDAATAIAGAGPAYVFHLAEALIAAAVALGLSEDLAALLTRDMISGAGELLRQSSQDPSTLRRAVASPGGVTAAALDVLMESENGLCALMKQATAAAMRRGQELRTVSTQP